MNRSTRAVMVAAILMAPIMAALPYHQAASPSFEVAAIKPFKDGAPNGPVMIGGGCRGVDSPAPGGPGGGPGGGGSQTTIMIGPGGGGGGGAVGGGGGGRGLPPGARAFGPPTTPIGRCVYTRMTLKTLINAAYRLTAMGGSIDQLLSGGPSWIATDAFDVEAKAEDTEHTTADQLRVMLQNLLADRFKLKFHREKREVQGFDLVAAKGGLKMKQAEGATGGFPGGMSMSLGGPGGSGVANMSSANATMTNIISFLSGRLGRAIQDKTGLTGNYNFSLSWTPGEGETSGLAGGIGGLGLQPPPSTAPSASEPGVSLFTALQEQMGLRLETAKVTIDAMVIDSAEKPEQ